MNVNPIIDPNHLPGNNDPAQPLHLFPGTSPGYLAAFNTIQVLAVENAADCRSTLLALGVQAPAQFDFTTHEYGLAFHPLTLSWVLALGGTGSTNWLGAGLQDCITYAHTHPRPATLGQFAQATLPWLQNQLLPQPVLQRLTLTNLLDWFPQAAALPGGTGINQIDFLPGFPVLFPSNGDIIANYTGSWEMAAGGGPRRNTLPTATIPNLSGPWESGPNTEAMYPPLYYDKATGWVATQPGAGRTQIEVSYGETVASLTADAATSAATGIHLVTFMYCPFTMTAGRNFTWNGVLKINPTVPGTTAWLFNTMPDEGTGQKYTRRQAAGLTNNRA